MRRGFTAAFAVLMSILLILGGCDAPLNTPIPSATLAPPTATPQPTPTAVPCPPVTPSPTATSGEGDLFPVEWPMPALTRDQVTAVRACDLVDLVGKRYPESLGIDDLEAAYTPCAPCDWATLAAAYGQRVESDDDLPEPARRAFRRAISDNHGYLLTQSLFYDYFDQARLVKAPPFAQQEIVRVEILYSWRGLGDKVSYEIEIGQANTNPMVSGVEKAINPDSRLVQALGPALTDLLPVDAPITLDVCTDNSPRWMVSIKFKDGTLLNMTTAGSNFLYMGGPWQAEIDGQWYVQVSFGFATAMHDLFEAMGLPLGEPGGMACFPKSILDKAFPLE